MRVVFMRRDVPNTVWSLIQRKVGENASAERLMPSLRTQQCAVLDAWDSAPHHPSRDFSIELEQ